MEVSKISFTSNIKFVNAETFEKVKCGNFIPWSPFSRYIQKADEFFTESVRTCTSGALINTKAQKVLAFHIFDSLEHLKELPEILDYMFKSINNPDKALLLGGKNVCVKPYSLDMFQGIKRELNKKIKDLTVFEEHRFPNAETNMCYSLKNDTWYINSNFRNKNAIDFSSVSSEDTLNECFKKVKISPNDQLIF